MGEAHTHLENTEIDIIIRLGCGGRIGVVGTVGGRGIGRGGVGVWVCGNCVKGDSGGDDGGGGGG